MISGGGKIKYLGWGKIRLEEKCSIAGAVAVFVIMVMSLLQLVTRYLLIPFPGLYELIALLMAGVTYLGIAYTQAENRHIRVGIILEHFPRRWRDQVEAVTLACAAGLFLVLTYASAVRTQMAFAVDEHTLGLLEVRAWPGMALVTIGCGLLSIRLLIQLSTIFGRLASSPKTSP